MSHEPRPGPSPDNNLVLRQLQGLRREMLEVVERQGRLIDLVNRLTLRMDQGLEGVRTEIGSVRRDIGTIQSDLVLMENKILDGQQDILRMVVRLDEGSGDDGGAEPVA